MKPESLVIANHNVAVNTFSDLVLTIKAPGSLLFSDNPVGTLTLRRG